MELNRVLIPTSDHSSTTRVKTVAKCHIFQEKKTDNYVTIWYFVLMWKANSKWKHHYLPLDDEMMIGVLPIQQMHRNWQNINCSPKTNSICKTCITCHQDKVTPFLATEMCEWRTSMMKDISGEFMWKRRQQWPRRTSFISALWEIGWNFLPHSTDVL
jgi:hypothetical protein